MRSTGGRLRRSMSAEALGLGTTNSPDKEGDAVAAMALRKEDYENRTTEQREVVRVLNEEIAKLQEQVLEQRRRLTDKGGVFAERETDTKFLVKVRRPPRSARRGLQPRLLRTTCLFPSPSSNARLSSEPTGCASSSASDATTTCLPGR